ncbi:unnamed protein product [Mytilus edulis]|uniref:Uncharacterized protein n=1 Tax=Mytilus edulis TaxID=6550 RepID=A0A8S3RLA5_MYTED|nr:unnamed protein product [Mytilus edulis]
MNVVVTPEDKNDIHLGKAVIHDLREIVDKTKLLRTDGARTAISIITASTNGSNVQNEKKKVLLAKKKGLPVKRISGGKIAASLKDRLTCCCRYHVEAKSLFLKCMEFRKKHIHPQLSEEEKNKFPVYEHLTDIAVATLCGKDTTHDCFNKACLDRKCTECGVRLLDFSDQELSDHPEAPTVSWKEYEYITVHNKRKLTLVRKCSKPSEMFAHFKHVLDHFAGHQFRAYWQNAQLKSLKENLPQNNCIVIHDYSENYACKERVEVQTTYFQRTEVTIHVSIIYRHSVLELDGVESFPDDPCIVTEHFFVISSDEKHDQCFTSKVQSLVKEYLDSISYNVNVFHEFTDDCPVQYKSRNCFECVNGNYNMCTNNAIGRKEVVPIRPDDKGTIDDDENDNEYTMSDLIVEGTVLALYTDEENAEFYLLRASSCPEKLRTSEVDDWGVSFEKNHKIIRGQYFKSDLNRSELSYKLIRRKKDNCTRGICNLYFTTVKSEFSICTYSSRNRASGHTICTR